MSFKNSLKDKQCLFVFNESLNKRTCLCVIGGFLRQRGEQTAGFMG